MDEYTMVIFGTSIRISCLASVDHINRKPRLIYNSIEDPDNVTLLVNASTYKASSPKAIHFGACLAHLLQKVWKADPEDCLFWLSKWYISDAFNRCNLRPTNIGNFTYDVPPLLADLTVLICINLVILMGWVNSLALFLSTLDTVAYNANGYALDPSSVGN